MIQEASRLASEIFRSSLRICWRGIAHSQEQQFFLLVFCLFINLSFFACTANSSNETIGTISAIQDFSEPDEFEAFLHHQSRDRSQMLITETSPFTLRGRFEKFLVDPPPGLFNFHFARPTLLGAIGGAICAAIVPLNLWIGNRQRLEGDGTWRRLWFVAIVMAFFQSLPLQTALLLIVFTPQFWPLENALIVSVVAFLIVLLISLQSLRPPLRLAGAKMSLERVTDPDFIRRLESMSFRLGIRPPVTRLLKSSGGTMALQGFAGGLTQPSLIVSDGLLWRLSTDETDAIVGHELGHIANRSLWFFPITACIAWTTAVLAALEFGTWTALLFGCALHTGLIRIVSRYFEYDSDRRAAQLTGTTSTISALDKIHLTSPVDTKGWFSFLAFCVATHPSLEERLSALKSAAPIEGSPIATWSEQATVRRRSGARFAALLWTALMTSVFFLPEGNVGNSLRFLILVGIVLTPSYLIEKAIRRQVKTEMKRRHVPIQRTHNSWTIIFFTILMFSSIYLVDLLVMQNTAASLVDQFWIVFILPFVIAAILFGLVIWKSRKSLHSQIRLAMYQHRWHDAVAAGQEHASNIQPDAALRHDLALCRWMTGAQEQAIAEIRQLREEFPEFKHPWLTEALMQLDRGQYEESLALIEEVREHLPGDIGVNGIAVRNFRLLNDLERMEAEIELIEQTAPDEAGIRSFRCAMAMDQNNPDLALTLWKEADRLAPGDAFVTLLKAEYEFRYGLKEDGDLNLAAANQLINASPFSFLEAERKYTEALISISTQKNRDAQSGDTAIS